MYVYYFNYERGSFNYLFSLVLLQSIAGSVIFRNKKFR